MFRHVVMFRWRDDATPEDVAAVSAQLAALPALVGSVREYRFGPDAGVNDGNCEFVIVADFDDVDAYLVYRDHPEHQRVIRDHIAPILAERHAVQHTVP
ncbi:MAG: Dabb family protein [Acidimicrobiia bacterium]